MTPQNHRYNKWTRSNNLHQIAYFILLKISLFFFILVFFTGNVFAQSTLKPFVVLELFTSQGCSKCPPAEMLLGKIIAEAEKEKKVIYALEYHVDYWNKYGWKDLYSSLKYTIRQKNYVSVLNESQAFTPQLIVNGEIAFVGSDEKLTRTSIANALKKPAVVDLEIKYNGILNDSMLLYYTTSKTDKNYFLKVALVEKEVSTYVSKGENSGKKLTHHHVVSVFSSFDLNTKSGEVKIPLNKKIPGKNNLIIAFVQHRQNMKILGVKDMEISP